MRSPCRPLALATFVDVRFSFGKVFNLILRFAFYSLTISDILQPVSHRIRRASAHPRGEPFMADDRSRAIDLAFAQIEKQFGKGSIMRLGSKEAIVPISVIPTGAISFDAALGVGGLPRGRVVEIFGPESSGKTTIALQVIAQAQATGGMAAFVDAEHALDPG